MNLHSVGNMLDVLTSRKQSSGSNVLGPLEVSTARRIQLGESMLCQEAHLSFLHSNSVRSFKYHGLHNASCPYMRETGGDTRRLLYVNKVPVLIDSKGDDTLQAVDTAQVSPAVSRTRLQHTLPRKPAAVKRLFPSHLIDQRFKSRCYASTQAGGLI